jgi:hypothetical protein
MGATDGVSVVHWKKESVIARLFGWALYLFAYILESYEACYFQNGKFRVYTTPNHHPTYSVWMSTKDDVEAI